VCGGSRPSAAKCAFEESQRPHFAPSLSPASFSLVSSLALFCVCVCVCVCVFVLERTHKRRDGRRSCDRRQGPDPRAGSASHRPPLCRNCAYCTCVRMCACVCVAEGKNCQGVVDVTVVMFWWLSLFSHTHPRSVCVGSMYTCALLCVCVCMCVRACILCERRCTERGRSRVF